MLQMLQNGPVARLENSNLQNPASKALHPYPLKMRRRDKRHATKTLAPLEATITQLTCSTAVPRDDEAPHVTRRILLHNLKQAAHQHSREYKQATKDHSHKTISHNHAKGLNHRTYIRSPPRQTGPPDNGHPANAPVPIATTVPGISNSISPHLAKQFRPMRARDEDGPNITRRRLPQSQKQLSHNSQTQSGILISTSPHNIVTPDFHIAPKASAPIRSREDEEPNVTRRRVLHPRKQLSHNSRTLSGMLISATLLNAKL